MKLLKFEAEWCNPCKMQSNILKDFTDMPVEIYDVEEDPTTANQYNIRNLPTMILIDDDGNELHRFAGLTQLETIKKVICEN